MPNLNPNEAPEWYVAVESSRCSECVFSGADHCLRKSAPCLPGMRKDGCSVIFKRKPAKPTRKPREWMAWAVVNLLGDDTEPEVIISRKDARDHSRACCRNGSPTKVIRVKIMEVLP